MGLSYDAIKQLWIQAGGPAAAADTAAAITMPESSGDPGIVQKGQPYSATGWGLWQITPGNSVPSVGINSALLDPLTNARAAVAKFKASGNSFQPWTTYNNGAYKKYLQGANWAGGGTASTTGDAQQVGLTDMFPSFLGGLGSLLFGTPATGPLSGIESVAKAISNVVNDLSTFFNMISILFKPQFWLRVGAFFMGILLLIGGIVALVGTVKA